MDGCCPPRWDDPATRRTRTLSGDALTDRFTFLEVPVRRQRQDFASAVRDGLKATPKSLPSRFFYDHRGSELFEQITALEEYYPTRCEASIFERFSEDIVHAAGPSLSLIEFGSGSSAKTRRLIDEILRRQGELDYAPIDISHDFLRESTEALLGEFPQLRITALAGEYFDAVGAMPNFDRPKLILFLGSNIGNFESAEAISFLSTICSSMGREDRLLVGTDLVKDSEVIQRAYNDLAGVTARFNLNLLERINSRLGGTFDLARFGHEAPYSEKDERVEMRIVSLEAQSVCVKGVDLAVDFHQGERLHTEFSQKYTEDSFSRLASAAGMETCGRWVDEKKWFALTLLRRGSV